MPPDSVCWSAIRVLLKQHLRHNPIPSTEEAQRAAFAGIPVTPTPTTASNSSIVAFSSCNNDKEETEYYFFKLTAAITDPGDMSQSEIDLVDQALDLLETTYNGNVFNQAMTVETAKSVLDKMADELKSKSGTSGQPVTVTLRLTSSSTGDLVETVTILPR